MSFDDPDSSRFSVAIALSAVYDYEPSPRDDPMITILDNYLRASLLGMAPGKILLVQIFPFCKYLWLS